MRYAISNTTQFSGDEWRSLMVKLGWMADAYAEMGMHHRVVDCEIARATIEAQLERVRPFYGFYTLTLSPMSKRLVHFAEYGDEQNEKGMVHAAV